MPNKYYIYSRVDDRAYNIESYSMFLIAKKVRYGFILPLLRQT